MKGTLVVDARVLYGSGIGRYVRELVPRLVHAAAFDDCILVGDPAELVPWAAMHVPAARIVPLVAGRHSLRAQVAWITGAAFRPPRPSVHWFPHFDAPVVRLPRPSVVTVHDLIPWRVRDPSQVIKRLAFPWALRRVTRAATRVITVSTASADDLVSVVPEVAPKIRVVPNGGAEIADRVAGTVPGTIATPFLLCVANRKPHKNIEVALDALALLRVAHPQLTLVVAGERFAHWTKTLAHAKALGVDTAVHDVGVTDDATLRALYGSCTALLAPSRLEGFGLPVVEAMACGAPVVAADLPWAHAVGGDAIHYADPDDPAAWARRIADLLSDPATVADARARGPVQAGQFTWARAAERTARVLREALDE